MTFLVPRSFIRCRVGATPREYEPLMMGHSLRDQMGIGDLSAGCQHCQMEWHLPSKGLGLLYLGGHIKMGTVIWELSWAGWKATGYQVPKQHPLGALQTQGDSVSVGGRTQQAWGSTYLPMDRGAFLNLTTWFQDLPSKFFFFSFW